MKLSEILRRVSEHEEVPLWDWNDGLCGNIYRLTDGHVKKRAQYWMHQHPDYSGRGAFPIKAEQDILNGATTHIFEGLDKDFIEAETAYLACVGDMYTGCYGKKRREMALYLSVLFAAEGM